MVYRSPTAIACQLPQSLPATTELASRHRACQRYTACQLSHSSLMVYRSPTAIACQLQQSLPTVCSLPQLANGVQIANCQSLSATTELVSHHRACQPPQSLPATTELASHHRACQRYTACQLPHSSLMVYRSPTATAYQLPHSSLMVYRSPTAIACQLP